MSLSGVTWPRATDPKSTMSVTTLLRWKVRVSDVMSAMMWRKWCREMYWLATNFRTASLMASLLLT